MCSAMLRPASAWDYSDSTTEQRRLLDKRCFPSSRRREEKLGSEERLTHDEVEMLSALGPQRCSAEAASAAGPVLRDPTPTGAEPGGPSSVTTGDGGGAVAADTGEQLSLEWLLRCFGVEDAGELADWAQAQSKAERLCRRRLRSNEADEAADDEPFSELFAPADEGEDP